jgi:AcrR family transcriptional regulator
VTEPRKPEAKTQPLGLRERGKRRRTERILDAALELLREDPEDGLSVDRIAERAEVAPMTVYNLVGNRDEMWQAIAERALQDLDVSGIRADDPRERALRIVDAVVGVLIANAPVFRALLAGWSRSGRVLEHDPTRALTDCLRDAAARGQVRSDIDVRCLGAVLAAGLVGTIQQWNAGALTDCEFSAQARAVIDVAFASQRQGPT